MLFPQHRKYQLASSKAITHLSLHDDKNMIQRQWLVSAGYVPPVLFWTTNIVCGMLLPNYNHATRLVSELGEIGTSTQHLFTAGLVLCSLCSIAFIAGLYTTANHMGISVIPILLLSTYSFSILGAACFPFL